MTLIYLRLIHLPEMQPLLNSRKSNFLINNINNNKKSLSSQSGLEQSESLSRKSIVSRGTIGKLHKMFFFIKKRLDLKDDFIKILLVIESIGLILTFSKSTFLGLLMGLIYIYWKSIVPRETSISSKKVMISLDFFSKMKKLFHVEQFRILATVLASLLVLIFIFVKSGLNIGLFQSLSERFLYLNIAYKVILENLLMGIGSGQFVILMQKFYPVILEIWQYQPVHNIFILIWAELGFIGLSLFIWFIASLLNLKADRIVPRGTIIIIYVKAILLNFVLISLFDHYLWDIQQGEIMLWMVLALTTGVVNVIDQKGICS